MGTIGPILDGTHLCFDYQTRRSKTGECAGSAQGVFSWDPEGARYRYCWFESSGASLRTTADLVDLDTLFLDWDNDCTQTSRRLHDDAIVLEMRCPEQGLTLRVDMSRSAGQRAPA